MEAINYLTSWTNYLLLLVPVGAGFMITYQAVRKISGDPDTITDANNKIKNTIKGAILMLCMVSTIDLIKSFYMVNGEFQGFDTSQITDKTIHTYDVLKYFFGK